MTLKHLDHINLRTSRLVEVTRFYEEALELKVGWRPPFAFNGIWLYLGERPVVHLVEVAEQPKVGEPQIEHYAFRAEGPDAFAQRMDALGIEYNRVVVPGNGNTQIFLRDPDGNRIEFQFEAGDAG